MAVYLELTTDKFKGQLKDLRDKKTKFDLESVRRPFRGIEVREDTFSVIKAIRADGTELALFDAGARDGTAGGDSKSPSLGSTFNYSNFMIQSAVEVRDEKSQVEETFGDPWIFFFGEKPRVLAVSGTLLNTLDFNWYQEWWRNYETYLRGTKLAQENARIYLYYNQQIVEGYILGAQSRVLDSEPHTVPFSFTLFVTGHTYLGEATAAGQYPIATSVKIDSLYDRSAIDATVRQLQQGKTLDQRTYQSTLDAVRRAAKSASPQHGTLTSAIAAGISDAESSISGFMNSVKEYFYGRYMVVPAGVAGSEMLVGEGADANKATYVGEMPQRSLPLRSQIADNRDEYVGGGSSEPTYNKALLAESEERKKLRDGAALEKTLMAMLREKGLRTDQPSKLQKLVSLKGLSGSVTQMGGAVDLVGAPLLSVSGVVHKPPSV